MYSKQYCRHLSSVDMVLCSFFGDCCFVIGPCSVVTFRNGWIENSFLFSVEVACDCED